MTLSPLSPARFACVCMSPDRQRQVLKHMLEHLNGMLVFVKANVLLGCMIQARVSRTVSNNILSPDGAYNIHIGGSSFIFEGRLRAGRTNGLNESTREGCCTIGLKGDFNP